MWCATLPRRHVDVRYQPTTRRTSSPRSRRSDNRPPICLLSIPPKPPIFTGGTLLRHFEPLPAMPDISHVLVQSGEQYAVLIIAIDEARAGMTLAAPVADPEDASRDLLNRGYRLEDAVVSRLCELGVASLYVDYPGLDDLDRHLVPQLSPV